MEEIWEDIEGWPKFKISNQGRVYNTLTGRYVKSSWSKRGFVGVNLERDGHRAYIPLARLVALAFVEGCFDGAEVSFKDKNRQNLSADNLEWATHYQNTRWNIGRRDYIRRGYLDKETGEIAWEGESDPPAVTRVRRNSITRTGILNRETGEIEW